MSSLSTSDLVKTIVDRLLAYSDGSGNSIATITSSRVYVTQAPDDCQYPNLVIRKINTQSDPELPNVVELFDVEVMCHGRPRAKEIQTELLADLATEALLTWRESSAVLGLSFGRTFRRDTFPPSPEPGDRELVQVRALIGCMSVPRYLTSALA